MSFKKNHLLTPLRPGGPQTWGNHITAYFNSGNNWKIKHTHDLFGLLSSPLYETANLVQSVLPISYRLWKKPLILSLHGNFREENNIWQPMYEKAIKMADVITVTSQYLKEALNLKKALVVPLSVSVPDWKQKEQTNSNQLNILTVSQFYFPAKAYGVLKIMEALDKQSNKNFVYSVLGDGPYLSGIKKAATKYSFPINFYGYTDPKPFFSQADVFLYWSDHDNTPYALLEAMAHGLPVITNLTGGIGELVNKENGYPVTSELGFRQALADLIKAPEQRYNLGRKAWQYVKENFSHEVVMPKWERLYGKMLGNYKFLE